jgi:uncharacterized protein (TIGR03435 family)
VCVGFIALVFCGLFGQTASSPATFEVASIRAHQGPIRQVDIATSGARFIATSTVFGFIMYAYNLRNDQVASKLPLDDAFYDIAAKSQGDAVLTKEGSRQGLQLLLADRFKLRIHREMREMQVYALVVDKNGPKFKESRASASDATPVKRLHPIGRNYEITLRNAPVNDLVNYLANSAFLDHPVLNETGLQGTYDIQIVYTPQTRAIRESEPDPSDISIFTAVRNQLGLRLDARKTTSEVLVVDHIEKPSEN